MDEKISVIVPVYKVQPYLQKCLDSIINQTYKNLEIILVNDGSPDNCGWICDEYAARDSRIKVIHQENGGVSSARNAGLSQVTGDWIGWVDSDDWIEPDMYEYLAGEMNSGADIIVCSRREEYGNRTRDRAWPDRCVFDTEDAMQHLLENDIMQNLLWDKIWRRKLFDGIVFPEGRTYEDISIMHILFERASLVCCLPEIKYHYLQRVDSIVSTTTLKNRIDHYMAAQQRYLEMHNNWPQFENLMRAQCVASAITIWASYMKNPKSERDKYFNQIKCISSYSKQHYTTALKYNSLGIIGKLCTILTQYTGMWSFITAYILGCLYKLRHGRNL